MVETIEIRSFMSGKKYSYYIKNIQSLEIQLNMPVSSTPMPMDHDGSNVLTKADGNTMRISVSWIIHDDDGVVVAPNVYNTAGSNVGGGTAISGYGSDSSIKLADNQVKFLTIPNSSATSGFQITDISDIYQILIGNVGVSRLGLIENLSVSKSSSTPITWTASLTFISGDVVTA